MLSIIIAFPKIEDAKKMKGLVVKNGFEVAAVCTEGSQVISVANELDEGIVICSCRFPDMHYSELNMYLPKGFEMLLMASAFKLEDYASSNIVCLTMPVKAHDLVDTIDMMMENYLYQKKRSKDKPKSRSSEDKAVIENAKQLLMERNNMSEDAAHRYIQKKSMENGTNMVETAQMLLILM